jgi:hypothetical protein
MKLVQARKMIRTVVKDYVVSTVLDELALYLREKATTLRTAGDEHNESDDLEDVAKIIDKTRAMVEVYGQ